MVKKVLLFFALILALIIVNLPIYYNYIGSKYYNKGNYLEAEKYFSKVNNWIGKYNLGNTHYRIGENDENIKLENYQKAVSNYDNSLAIKYDEKTEDNRNFVLEKIKELEQKEEQVEGQNGENTKENKGEQSNDYSSNEQGQNQQNTENPNNGEGQGDSGETYQYSLSGSQNGSSYSIQYYSSEPLSEEDKKVIEEYAKQLQEAQNAYSEGFNKIYQEGSNDLFESFFGFDPFSNDPFFNNSLLNGGQNKKDW